MMDSEQLKTFCVAPATPLIEAMKRMNEAGYRVLFVTDGSLGLLGILSAGDVRRWIVNSGGMIDVTIENVYNRRPLTLAPGFSVDEVRKLSLEKEILEFPVVNAEGKLCDAVIWSHIFNDGKRDRTAPLRDVHTVIMAGGVGSRMRPFTNILPKPLLPLGERTVLEEIMDGFHALGTERFHVIINHKKGMILSYFENIKTPYAINFIDEGGFLGTCGGISKVPLDSISDDFILSNCDTILDADFAGIYRFHRENRNEITMVCTVRDFTIPYGVVELNDAGQIDRVIEKPSHNYLVNTGVYVLNKRVIDSIPRDRVYHTTDLIRETIEAGGRTSVYPLPAAARLDTGQWEEYFETLVRCQQPVDSAPV